jgi:hypothetical protein
LPFANLGRHKWLRLLLVTALLYLVFLPLWWQSLGALSILFATFADVIYHLFDSRVSIVPDGSNINVFVTAGQESGFGGQVQSSALRISTITYGFPMLAALVISTKAETVFAKLKALGAGIGALLVITLPPVMLWAALTSAQLDDRIAIATQRNDRSQATFLYYLFHGYAFSQPVIAVGVWLSLVMLGLFKRRTRTEQPLPAAGRNDPCPCGSGRKYKRCCGRA